LLRLIALNKLLLNIIVVREDRGEKKSQNAKSAE